MEGKSQGRDVATEVLKIYQCSNDEQIRRVSTLRCPIPAVCSYKLTVVCVEILQGGCDVAGILSSKYFTTNWGNDGRYSIHDGFKIDGRW